MTQHWAVINRETGETSFVERPADQHPADSGYGPKAAFKYVKLDRAFKDGDRFDGKKLVECPVEHKRIRHIRRGAHHLMTRIDVEDMLRALMHENNKACGLPIPTVEQEALWFPNLTEKEKSK